MNTQPHTPSIGPANISLPATYQIDVTWVITDTVV